MATLPGNQAVSAFRGAAMRAGVPAGVYELTERQVQQTIRATRQRFATLRAGGASTSLDVLEGDLVAAYGSPLLDLLGKDRFETDVVTQSGQGRRAVIEGKNLQASWL